jgi:hypothetical protein
MSLVTMTCTIFQNLCGSPHSRGERPALWPVVVVALLIRLSLKDPIEYDDTDTQNPQAAT